MNSITNQKKEAIRKFKIREFIASYSHKRQGEIINELAKECKISPEQMRKIAGATFNDRQDINTFKLRVIAKYFKVTPNDILNAPPTPLQKTLKKQTNQAAIAA